LGSQTRRQVVTLSRKVTNHTAYLGNFPVVVSVSVLAGWLAGWRQSHITSLVQFATETHRVSCLPPESPQSSYLRNYQVPLPSLQFPLTQQAPFAGHPPAKAANFLGGPHLYATVVNTVYTIIVNECLWKLCPTMTLRNPFRNVLNCLAGNCVQ
jgi:hypothetical protein